MPAIYARDPNTGTMVPVFGGGMTQAAADAAYVQSAGGTITGSFTVPEPPTARPEMGSQIATKGYADKVLVGMVIPYAGASAPSGWFLCQGQAVSRTTYAALFAVCSTYHGAGDGSSTFNLPDFRGRALVGIGSSGYFDAIGERQGTTTVTLAKSQLPNFSGQVEMHSSGSRTAIFHTNPNVWPNTQPGAYATGYQNSGGSSIGYVYLNMGFGGGAHNNVTWSFAVHYIIKY